MPDASFEQLVAEGWRHQSAGRRAQAESLYRYVLGRSPNHAGALIRLGILASQSGRPDVAAELFSQLVQAHPDHAEAHSNLGSVLVELGRTEQAIVACRRAIELNSSLAVAHFNLGNALGARDDWQGAADAYRSAIALQPSYATAHNNLGAALRRLGDRPGALACFIRAVECNPNLPEGWNNLGHALCGQQRWSEAADACRQAIALQPQYAEAMNNLGNALVGADDISGAEAAYRQAISLRQGSVEFHSNLGSCLTRQRNYAGAADAHRAAVRFDPANASAYDRLGQALIQLRRHAEAIAAFSKAVDLQPDFAAAWVHLGNARQDLDELDAAIDAYERALTIDPNHATARNNLANALADRGENHVAMQHYENAVKLDPTDPGLHSNLVYAAGFDPSTDSQAILLRARQWARQHGAASAPAQLSAIDRSPDRMLRVGYVSADFRNHALGRYVLPVLREHDRGQFKVYLYSDMAQADEMTADFHHLAGAWCDITNLTAPALARRIVGDRVDILVDLAMHMAHNRLPLFAMKPAPVQVTFGAYPGTTGLETIDYRLTDPWLDPPGADEHLYAERSWRLPHSYWCYDEAAMTMHMQGAAPDIAATPVLANGFITFGSLNQFVKTNDGVFALWIRVLHAVKHSQLILLAPQGRTRECVRERFEQGGIDPSRVRFFRRMRRSAYLGAYDHIDIGLDTFPYNGHITTLDAAWMGVPVITLVGQTVAGRAGWSHANNLGLTELAARSGDEYVRIATDLAADVNRLSTLRRTLRSRMRASPLCDAVGFTRAIETAYREMWKRWARSGGPPVRDSV